MFKTIVLICSLATPGQDCDQKTAVDILEVQDSPSSQRCGFLGQSQIATTSVAPEPGKQYMKILCVREAHAAKK
jgi:hypothetical protein